MFRVLLKSLLAIFSLARCPRAGLASGTRAGAAVTRADNDDDDDDDDE